MKTQTENTNVTTENQEEEQYIECPNCQKQISNKDINKKERLCPYCDYPLEKKQIENKTKYITALSKTKNSEIRQNTVSIICCVIAIITGLFVFILGIALISSTGIILPSIFVWIGGFVLCFFIYALGELIQKTSEISDFAKIIYEHISKK